MEDGIERVDTDENNNSKIENNNKNDKNITITNFYKKSTYPMISLLTVLIKLA